MICFETSGPRNLRRALRQPHGLAGAVHSKDSNVRADQGASHSSIPSLSKSTEAAYGFEPMPEALAFRGFQICCIPFKLRPLYWLYGAEVFMDLWQFSNGLARSIDFSWQEMGLLVNTFRCELRAQPKKHVLVGYPHFAWLCP